MKILFVCHSFPPYSNAGAELYADSLSASMAKRHEVMVFHRICDPKSPEYALRWTTRDDRKLASVNNTFRECRSFRELYANEAIEERFERVLDTFRPDIVHIHHLIFLSAGIVQRVKARGIPVVMTLHDYWLICPQWHFLRNSVVPCVNAASADCVRCCAGWLALSTAAKRTYSLAKALLPPAMTRFLKRRIAPLLPRDWRSREREIELRKACMRQVADDVDMFVAPSRFLKEKFLAFGVPDTKILSSVNGTDGAAFAAIPPTGKRQATFGFIGTILPAKGVHLLIEAFNRLSAPGSRLLIYGELKPYDGFERYPEHLRRLAGDGPIEFRGGFDHSRIAEVLATIDFLVVPSIWWENCPLTILEARRAGVRVIASAIGGIPELVLDGKDGITFQPGDVGELAGVMKRCLDGGYPRQAVPPVKTMEEDARLTLELYARLVSTAP